MTGATVTSYTDGTVSRIERVAYQQDVSGTRTAEVRETDTDGDGDVDSGMTTALLNDLHNPTGYSQVLLETTRDLVSGEVRRQVTYTIGLDQSCRLG